MRLRIFAVLLIICILPSFAAYQGGHLDDNGLSENVKVVLDLDNFSEFDIGFSKNEISDFSDPVISLENGEIEQLIISGDVATASSPLYVYWKILSSNNVSASLSIPSALRGEAGELDWMVSLADGSASVASNSGSKAIAVIPESAAFGNIGSAELLISTENVNGGEVLPGEYKGELRLSISID